MATYYPAGGKTYSLQSSISSTQTTITLSSFKIPVTDADMTMAEMNTSIAYGTIAPKTSQSEFISFTGITQNADGTATLTGVTRGLDKTYPYTESSSFKLPHAGGSQFILSDAPQVFGSYPAKVNAETISGLWTFPAGGNAAAPVSGASYSAPTNDLEYASKKYVDDVAISGAPDATTGVKGIVQLPTQAQQEAGTATGSTGATLVLTNALYGARSYVGYAADSGANDTYVITLAPVPTAYFTGMTLLFKANTANTTAATLNVNSLGAKNIYQGGAALITGTISAGSFVLVQYDGTQFNILSVSDGSAVAATAGKLAQRNTTGDITVNTTPTASTDAASKAYVDTKVLSSSNGTTTKNAADASTTQNIAHGLGEIPKSVEIFCTLNTAITVSGSSVNRSLFANTFYNGTTQSSQSLYAVSDNQTADQTFTLNTANAAATQVGVVTFDATNIIITWTKTGSPTGTYNLLWRALAS